VRDAVLQLDFELERARADVAAGEVQRRDLIEADEQRGFANEDDSLLQGIQKARALLHRARDTRGVAGVDQSLQTNVTYRQQARYITRYVQYCTVQLDIYMGAVAVQVLR
jgi:hypothetical protein